tara:strand:+ start:28 stop:135 length:108 start_codon:yes stop_codon:yes gene_type:complete
MFLDVLPNALFLENKTKEITDTIKGNLFIINIKKV